MVNNSVHLEDKSLKFVCCLVSIIIIIAKLRCVHEARRTKLKGEMGKSGIIMGSFLAHFSQ